MRFSDIRYSIFFIFVISIALPVAYAQNSNSSELINSIKNGTRDVQPILDTTHDAIDNYLEKKCTVCSEKQSSRDLWNYAVLGISIASLGFSIFALFSIRKGNDDNDFISFLKKKFFGPDGSTDVIKDLGDRIKKIESEISEIRNEKISTQKEIEVKFNDIEERISRIPFKFIKQLGPYKIITKEKQQSEQQSNNQDQKDTK